jgi:hypothetical protein
LLLAFSDNDFDALVFELHSKVRVWSLNVWNLDIANIIFRHIGIRILVNAPAKVNDGYYFRDGMKLDTYDVSTSTISEVGQRLTSSLGVVPCILLDVGEDVIKKGAHCKLGKSSPKIGRSAYIVFSNSELYRIIDVDTDRDRVSSRKDIRIDKSHSMNTER